MKRGGFMAQGIFGGATSYEEQSPNDMLSDVSYWIEYTEDRKSFILKQKELLHQSGFWCKVGDDFKATIVSTISYFETILYDLSLVENSFKKNYITEKEINLLRKIGRNAVSYNHEYGRTFKTERPYWHDYGNPDFDVAEEIYKKGRDYFVTMQDAENAAARLEDYVEKGQVVNNTLNIQGNVSNSQVQQGTIDSSQTMIKNNDFDYIKVLEIIQKIKQSTTSEDFDKDFGDNAEVVKNIICQTIKMLEDKEEPSKIKSMLGTLQKFALDISSSVIASGICGLITQLPIW